MTRKFLVPLLALLAGLAGPDATARAEKANGGNGNGNGNGTKPVKRAASKSPVKRAAAAANIAYGRTYRGSQQPSGMSAPNVNLDLEKWIAEIMPESVKRAAAGTVFTCRIG